MGLITQGTHVHRQQARLIGLCVKQFETWHEAGISFYILSWISLCEYMSFQRDDVLKVFLK